MHIRLGLLLFLPFLCCEVFGQAALRKKLAEISESISGDAGVAIRLIERGDTLSYHGSHPFPMQSVYKFPLALQVFSDVDNGKLVLEHHVQVPLEDYYPTHSPLIKDYPDGHANPTIRELLSYMIEWSDNVACDVLFREVGGPKRVDQFLNAQGIRNIAVRNTEREMHANDQLQYQNWSTPQAMAELLAKFYSSKLLTDTSRTELYRMMTRTKTGPRRIRGQLPSETIVANRTGTGARTKDRRISAINDIGIVELPNGEHMVIVIFITNTHEEIPDGEDVIAQLAKAAYEYYGNRK